MSNLKNALQSVSDEIKNLYGSRSNVERLKVLVEDAIEIIKKLGKNNFAFAHEDLQHTLDKEVEMASSADDIDELLASFEDAKRLIIGQIDRSNRLFN